MYLPKHFSSQDEKKIRKLIEENAFITLLSYPKDSIPFINHLPVIFSPEPGENEILLGHMAKRNPQWMHFKENPQATIIVQGPHTYITPSWYKSGRDVPTWNYVALHLQGHIQLVEKFSEQTKVLKQLTSFFERPNPKPWEFELPEDLLDPAALTGAIISFKFKIEKVDAKFKLSQNRSKEDKDGVIDGLNNRTDEMSQKVRQLMIENQ